MKEEVMPISAIIPVEKRITRNGIEITARVAGDTKEVVEETVRSLSSMGLCRSASEIREIDPESSKGNSFGISNWSHCQWEPKGPRPNWENPENPSVN
jgi:hypothetical protein